ncbi:MAG: DegQ family serine endoprotease [Nitrospirae bacterium]|nr:DegQ family serine endoprotease [Nitrospirota bacterium]MBI3352329.1 DegQ family serine endoprotease [Nitrospirota bacterium]
MQDYKTVRKWVSISIFLIVLGVILGITISSNLNLTPSGKAVNNEKKSAVPLLPGLHKPDETFVEISKAATPAVVNISTTRLVKNEMGPNPFFEDPFFRRFFGDELGRQFEQPRERKEQSLGSGVIVESNGIIITNNHVIANADEIKVLLSDKREFKGKVLGTDPKTDIAVVKIEARDLPTIPMGDSSKMEVGEYVLAIGNPFGLNQTVTMGIISAIGRANVGISDYEDFIQTDAAINPGNSGGALVNTRGELIGINTAIFSKSGGYMGIGFAIPTDMARAVLESIKKEGKVVRGWLGVSIQEINPNLAKQFGIKENAGALVSDVMEKSPAEKAGIKRGDVIVQYQGNPVDNPGHLRNSVAQTRVGTRVKMAIIRDKKEISIEVNIGEQPKDLVKTSGEEGGKNSEESRDISGLEVTNLTPETARRLGVPFKGNHIAVTNVEAGSPAEEAGILRGDILLEINRIVVKNTEDYNRIMSQINKGTQVLFLINRQGRTLFVTFIP